MCQTIGAKLIHRKRDRRNATEPDLRNSSERLLFVCARFHLSQSHTHLHIHITHVCSQKLIKSQQTDVYDFQHLNCSPQPCLSRAYGERIHALGQSDDSKLSPKIPKNIKTKAHSPFAPHPFDRNVKKKKRKRFYYLLVDSNAAIRCLAIRIQWRAISAKLNTDFVFSGQSTVAFLFGCLQIPAASESGEAPKWCDITTVSRRFVVTFFFLYIRIVWLWLCKLINCNKQWNSETLSVSHLNVFVAKNRFEWESTHPATGWRLSRFIFIRVIGLTQGQ